MSIKISELPSAEAVNNGDYVAIVQDGTTKKATASMLSADIATTINSSSTNNTAAGAKAVYDYAAPKKHDSTAQTYGVGTDEKYGHVMLVDDLNSSSLQAGKALSSHQGYVIKGLLDDKQDIINGYNKINADYVDDTTSENKFITEEQIQEIEELKAENEALLDQIPTATATGDNINVQDSSNLPIKEFDMLGNATQADTPTPDYPQDIHVVTGDNTVKVLGKNLFNSNATYYYRSNESNVAISGNTISFTNNFTYANNYIWWNIPVAVGQNLTISYSNMAELTGNDNNRVSYHFSDVPNITSGTSPTITGIINKTNKKDTITATAKYLILILRTATGVNGYTISDLMVEAGETATPYTPYKAPQTQLLSLGSIELAKIGDYTDRIFKAVSSNNPLKPSYYDTLPSEVKAGLTSGAWYKQGNIGKRVLTGQETFVQNDSKPSRVYFTINFSSSGIYTYSSTTDVPDILSTKFAPQMQSGAFYPNHIALTTGNRQMYFIFEPNTTEQQARTILASMPVYYRLETPTYTEITDNTLIGQLENILAMHTNKNVTNAWIEPSGTNAQAGLTLTYRQDLATLIAG